jgi:hypothetical protein
MATITQQRVFISPPDDRSGVMGGAYYSMLERNELVAIYSYTSRSDTADVAYEMRSTDNGRTWDDAREIACRFDHPEGTGRRHPRGGYVDPRTGRFITIWTEGVLPLDEPLEGMRRWTLHYAVSEDGGRTTVAKEQIIHEGTGYDSVHHLPGVTVGKNMVMMGDLGERPLTRSDGTILVPVQSSPTGPDGDYYNPGAGFTYSDVLVLFGTWKSDTRLAWTASQRLAGDPTRSTRGLIEPTIAELSDGRILMVMRGSNDARPELPGHKWVSYSDDGGNRWSTATPWTYDDGSPFFSPSACSQLIPHSDGRIFWMGNICQTNPKGNRPRYPLVLGEVDTRSGALIRSSVSVIDDKRPQDNESLTLSNFYVREDRESNQLVLYLPRAFAQGQRRPDGGYYPWPLWEYHIAV